MKRYIVWNENKTEGYITDDKQDAKTAREGKSIVGPAVKSVIQLLRLLFMKLTAKINCRPLRKWICQNDRRLQQPSADNIRTEIQ